MLFYLKRWELYYKFIFTTHKMDIPTIVFLACLFLSVVGGIFVIMVLSVNEYMANGLPSGLDSVNLVRPHEKLCHKPHLDSSAENNNYGDPRWFNTLLPDDPKINEPLNKEEMEELEVFEFVNQKIKWKLYTWPFSDFIICYIFKNKGDKSRNVNKESFLRLIALQGPELVLTHMKQAATVLTTLSALFLNITVPLTLDPGEFLNETMKNIFGALMVISTIMSFNGLLISTFMYIQCELCDVTDSKIKFLKRLDKHENMITLTSSTWCIGAIVISLPAIVIKASDSYGPWMGIYYTVLLCMVIYTLRGLVKAVIFDRISFQKKRFDSMLHSYKSRYICRHLLINNEPTYYMLQGKQPPFLLHPTLERNPSTHGDYFTLKIMQHYVIAARLVKYTAFNTWKINTHPNLKIKRRWISEKYIGKEQYVHRFRIQKKIIKEAKS